MPHQSLKFSWRHHQALTLVNEKPYTHIALAAQIWPDKIKYGKAYAAKVLDELWDMGFVLCMGHFRNYEYKITDCGKTVLRIAKRPLKPIKVSKSKC